LEAPGEEDGKTVDFASIGLLLTVLVQPAQVFCLFLIISLTVNLEFGYAGIPNFGKVLFVAAGAFLSGSLAYRLMILVEGLKTTDIFASQPVFIPRIDKALQHSPLLSVELALVMLAIGACGGALFGYLSSYPAIRLREDYLGMLLLASGEFFNIFSLSYHPFLGGGEGMSAPSPIFDIGKSVGYPNLVVLAVLAAGAVLVYLYSERVGRSPLGRTLRAMRDNEVATAALGKDNVAIRRKVLLVGSALAGMAGVLWIFYQPYISPGTTGSFTRQTFTFIPFVIVIMGGASNNRGVLMGAFVYMLIVEAFGFGTTYFIGQGINLFGPVDPTRVETILIGAVLIAILIRRPQGLIPEKPTLTMSKAKLRELAGLSKGGPSEERPEASGSSPS
jgi:branched-chain amino acid transport system permease protein